ncbi:hypothetical protein Fcan01_10218 [Folsomia candida]|uniref:F-box domain-containing protein n=1 Tax=Folsomia candida TaxID=158441 RepID=A0A226EE10_FOLCA|nr:hypothetical protein Fcan01_10218 [Folsomia candida]
MEGEDAILFQPQRRFCGSCQNQVWGTSCGCVTPENSPYIGFQESAVLPYIENQKYTFGSKYTSREEQGEFIFVRTNKNPGNLAEITCSSGNWWITPAGEVYRATEHQDHGEDFNISDGNKVDLTPGQNYLILSHIFSYLPFNTLKMARLVCTQWDDEAARILKKKSIVSFKFRDWYDPPFESTKLLRYVKEMKNLQPPSLALDLPPCTTANTKLDNYPRTARSAGRRIIVIIRSNTES